jgi:hypothetical protein
MHEFNDHFVRDSRRARAQRRSSLARCRCPPAQVTQSLLAVASGGRMRFIAEDGKGPYPDME